MESQCLNCKSEETDNSPMPGWCNEVKQSVHPVISESWVTLDARFFCEDIIVLPFKVSNYLRETAERV